MRVAPLSEHRQPQLLFRFLKALDFSSSISLLIITGNIDLSGLGFVVEQLGGSVSIDVVTLFTQLQEVPDSGSLLGSKSGKLIVK